MNIIQLEEVELPTIGLILLKADIILHSMRPQVVEKFIMVNKVKIRYQGQ